MLNPGYAQSIIDLPRDLRRRIRLTDMAITSWLMWGIVQFFRNFLNPYSYSNAPYYPAIVPGGMLALLAGGIYLERRARRYREGLSRFLWPYILIARFHEYPALALSIEGNMLWRQGRMVDGTQLPATDLANATILWEYTYGRSTVSFPCATYEVWDDKAYLVLNPMTMVIKTRKQAAMMAQLSLQNHTFERSA